MQYQNIKVSMADSKTTPVMVRFPREQLDLIDAWRRLQADLPTRPEAVRRLTEKGLRGTQIIHRERQSFHLDEE